MKVSNLRGLQANDYICRTFWKKQNYKDREQICGYHGSGVGEGLITIGQHERIPGGVGIVLYPVYGHGSKTPCWHLNAQNWIEKFKVNFSVYKLIFLINGKLPFFSFLIFIEIYMSEIIFLYKECMLAFLGGELLIPGFMSMVTFRFVPVRHAHTHPRRPVIHCDCLWQANHHHTWSMGLGGLAFSELGWACDQA